jgi:hypothetical protein
VERHRGEERIFAAELIAARREFVRGKKLRSGGPAGAHAMGGLTSGLLVWSPADFGRACGNRETLETLEAQLPLELSSRQVGERILVVFAAFAGSRLGEMSPA